MSFKQEARKFYPKWPIYNEKEINALTEVIKSGEWWCGAPGAHQGNNVWAFQEEFAQLQGSKYCVAVCNGTVAIEAALMALNIGLGDEVIVSDYTFVASASAVIATNAVPIFCDIDPNTLVMDVNNIEELITERTRAIIPVHLGGNPVNMEHLMALASNYDLKVVEDCAHAHGSDFKGKKVGNWGDAGTFSFQASKVLTSGEGGAIICNSEELADNIYSYIDCGRKKNQYFYKHYSYGTNYRMTEYQAAVLRAQLKKFPDQHKLRNENALYLIKKLNDIKGIKTMELTPGTTSLGWYVFPIVFEPKEFGGITKSEFYKKLNRNGVPTDDCYPPLHSLDCFKTTNLKKGIDYSKANWGGEKSINRNFPVVSDIYSRSIEFPQEMFLADRENLDNVVTFIKSLKEKN
ncbi:MAG: DegT/DnrJ/EryC1/StrS family aminotransferase [Candidatus Lokiarchaeota archaeon]|nr:DegT/DnrJ/EryC1/StrS family aminotransferase [Candidatus Lokiarchaeota archaeon]